jgi:hypothetical protein
MSISVHEHYRRLLLLPEPWEVTKVEDDLVGQSVTVWLRWPDGVVSGERESVYFWRLGMHFFFGGSSSP